MASNKSISETRVAQGSLLKVLWNNIAIIAQKMKSPKKGKERSEVLENFYAVGAAFFIRKVCGTMQRTRNEQLFKIFILGTAHRTNWHIQVHE